MKKDIGWKIYFLFFCLMAWGNLASLFEPDSPPYIYYHILIAFYKALHLFLDLNVVSALLTFLSAVPMFLCIYRIPWLPQIVWEYFFMVRLIFDLMGRPYEFIFFKSLWIDDWRFGLAYLFSLGALLFPSYWLLFRYAFQRNSPPAKS